jgi:hypothetical protein
VIPVDFSLASLAVCCLAFVVAGTVKGAIGAGLPAIAVPIMVTTIDPAVAIALTVVPVAVANTWQALQGAHYREALRRFRAFILALVVGVALGTQILVTVDPATMALTVGIIVVASTVLQFLSSGLTIPERITGWLDPTAGLSMGVVGGATAMYAPTIVYFSAQRLQKDLFVSLMALIAICGTAPLYISLAVNKVLSWQELGLSALAFVPVALGMVVGKRMRDSISQQTFQRLLLAALFLLGLGLIAKGLV